MIHLRIHLLVLIALISCSCSTEDPSSHPKTGHYFPPRGYPEKSIVHLESFIDWNPEKLQDAAQAEMVILPIDWCFSPESEGILEELRQLNPGIQIIGYQVMLGVYTLWPDTSYLQATLPYKLDYYQAVTNEWASTTTGDTLMIWRDLILLNPIDGDEINRSLIDTMIDLIVEYQSQTGDALDGIMHDYFMYRPYINPTIRDLVEGEIDLNGNGVIIDEDTGEQALFYAWQKEYAREIRNRFGEDFIQVGNGRPPQEDAELAAILNGIFYENFPNLRSPTEMACCASSSTKKRDFSARRREEHGAFSQTNTVVRTTSSASYRACWQIASTPKCTVRTCSPAGPSTYEQVLRNNRQSSKGESTACSPSKGRSIWGRHGSHSSRPGRETK